MACVATSQTTISVLCTLPNEQCLSGTEENTECDSGAHPKRLLTEGTLLARLLFQSLSLLCTIPV